MKKFLALCFAFGTLLSLNAFSQDLQLGTPGYGGTGCPGGSASVILSPDQTSLSILFDSFVAEAGGGTNKSFDRKTCNIAIPVHVPHGISLSIFKVDYRGFVAVPFGGQARFDVEYFFAGRRGPQYTKTFTGETRDYLLTNNIGVVADIWSACGEDVNLRVNSAMFVKTNRSFAEVMGTVDSVDVQSGIVYHLKWRRC